MDPGPILGLGRGPLGLGEETIRVRVLALARLMLRSEHNVHPAALEAQISQTVMRAHSGRLTGTIPPGRRHVKVSQRRARRAALQHWLVPPVGGIGLLAVEPE